jgi:hypothetical protein
MNNVYFTTGQVAKELRVSVSTLKRWLQEEENGNGNGHGLNGGDGNGHSNGNGSNPRNAIGWRLFSSDDLERLRILKVEKKRNGKHYSAEVLAPVF